MGKRILGIVLWIGVIICSIYMSYGVGSQIVKDYYIFGVSGVIISLIAGTIMLGVILFIINKIVGKLYAKINKEGE